MRSHARFIVLLAVPLLVVGGAFGAWAALHSDPGGGTLTRDIAFYGPGSGTEFPSAGIGTVPAGSAMTTLKVLLPAFAIPGAGGGGDENDVVATIRGHHTGFWIVGAKIRPLTSGYDKESGTLVVWLNKPTPAPIQFTYLTFGLFND